MSQIEMEEQSIEDDYDNGIISLKECNEALKDLYSDYQAQAEDAAEKAYMEESDRW